MNLRNTALFFQTFAVTLSLSACIITVGGTESAGPEEDSGCDVNHGYYNPDSNQCYCQDGYDWCTLEPDDYSCCTLEGSCGDDPNVSLLLGECTCNPGYDWCTPDLDDLSCCKIPPPKVDCSENPAFVFVDPGEFCNPQYELEYTNNVSKDAKAAADTNCEQTKHYVCIPNNATGDNTGTWVLSKAGDLDCVFQGFDGSKGSYMENGIVVQSCW